MRDIRTETAELYERQADRLYRLAHARLLNAADAEDAVAETFAKYLRKMPEFRDASHEKAWFLRVCINTCNDLARRRTVRAYTPIEELSEVLAAQEKDKSVLESVYELPEKYRMVLYLHYYQGYTAQETAEILGKNPSTVRTWLVQARGKLKEILEAEAYG